MVSGVSAFGGFSSLQSNPLKPLITPGPAALPGPSQPAAVPILPPPSAATLLQASAMAAAATQLLVEMNFDLGRQKVYSAALAMHVHDSTS